MHNGLRILIVDDDEVDQEATKRAIAATGVAAQISTANNGNEALSELRENRGRHGPSVVLLDLSMPCMNGHELLETVSRDATINPGLIFVLSSTNDPDEIASCYRKGAAGFMNKATIDRDFALFAQFLDGYAKLTSLSG